MYTWYIRYTYGEENKEIVLDARNIIKAIETLTRIQYDKSKTLFVLTVACSGIARR